MASKDEVLVLAQVLQNVLTADSEHPFAVGMPAECLLGEPLAGDTLWDIPHAVQTAALHPSKTFSCTNTQGQIDCDSVLHSTPGPLLLVIEIMTSVNRKCMCCTFLLLLSLSQCSLWTHHRCAWFSCVNTNKNRQAFQCAVGQSTC